MCLSKKMGQGVHTVQEDTDDSDDLSETFFIKMMSHDENVNTRSSRAVITGQPVNSVTEDKWTAPLLMGLLYCLKLTRGLKLI